MLIFQGAVLGFGATILMDIWAQILGRLPGQALPNWAPVGRWFRHLPSGVIFHDDIAKAEPYAHELALGWAAHYAVGIAYGMIFALIVGEAWIADPSLLPALTFGLVVIAAGWFLLQPGMGLGWAASRTPNPAKVRLLGIVSHSIFGIGLYLTARLVL